MEVLMPKDFNLENSLKFCELLDELEYDEIYEYNYKNMSTVEPFGMLIIGSKIRKFKMEKNKSYHTNSNYERNGYAGHMGYFKSIGVDFGKKPGEANGNDNYIPLTVENVNEVYHKLYFDKAYEGYLGLNDYIERNIATALANVISRKDKVIKDNLTFCISELIRNVFEHSKSKDIWYSGQYWPQKDLVEISILDEGTGITESLRRNKKIEFSGDEEALKLCVEPGVTKAILNGKKITEEDNQGFGLYMTKNICEQLGDFVICSGDSCLISDKEGTRIIKTSFKGTIVRLRLKVSEIFKANELKVKLSREGTEKSKKLNSLDKISIDAIKGIE